MRDLGYIAEINGPRRVELQAERAANIVRGSHRSPLRSFLEQKLHGERVEERAHVNGQPNGYSAVTEAELLAPYISGDDVDLSPADRRAIALDRRADDLAAERARVNGFHPGPETVRATPRARNRVTNAPAYYGEYRVGTVWHTVLNNSQLPICYTTPEYALAAALLHFDAAR